MNKRGGKTDPLIGSSVTVSTKRSDINSDLSNQPDALREILNCIATVTNDEAFKGCRWSRRSKNNLAKENDEKRKSWSQHELLCLMTII
jgi:hypothetical protein